MLGRRLFLTIRGVVLDQTLAGMGWDGREAPLAVAVTYVDAEGTSHVGLSEDVMSSTNMLYLGFTAFTIQNASYVRALGQIELVFTFIATTLFFREKVGGADLLGILLVSSGIVILLLLG